MALAPRRPLFSRAVQLDHRLVDPTLVLGVHAGQGVEDLAVDGVDRLAATPLPPHISLSPSRSSTASWAPVEAPEGTAARPKAAVIQDHIHFHRRIAPAVENLAGDDVGDVGHEAWVRLYRDNPAV